MTLGEVIVPSGTVDPTSSPNRKFRYVDVSSVSNETFSIENAQEILGRDAPSRARRLIKSGDLIFATIRPTLKRIAVVPDEFDGQVCSTGYFVFRTKSFLDSRFLFYHLLSDGFMAAMEALQTGASYPAVNDSQVKQQIVAFPPLPEQRRIVAVLDEAFEGLAIATANTEKSLKNARELFEGYLNFVFAQNGEGGTEKPIGDFCDLLNGFAFKSDDAVQSSITQLVRMGNLYGNRFDLKRTTVFYPDDFGQLHRKFLLTEGDLIISLTGTTGKEDYGYVVKVPKCDLNLLMNQRIAKFVLIRKDLILTEYLYYFLRSSSFLAKLYATANGTRQANLSSVTIKTLNVPICSIEKQKLIVASLAEFADYLTSLEENYAQKLAAIAELKQSLLQKAFAGELTKDFRPSVAASSASSNVSNLSSADLHAGVLVMAYDRHHRRDKHKTFGRVKAQKFLHLVESVGRIDLGRMPIKDAAGPNDFHHMLRAEDWAKQSEFFEFAQRPSGNGYEFKKLARFDEQLKQANAALEPFRADLNKVIDLIIDMNSEEAELFATVHSAWNNLIIDGKPISDAAIVREARENWHPDKLRISEQSFHNALNSIRTRKLEPDGTAKYVGGQQKLI